MWTTGLTLKPSFSLPVSLPFNYLIKERSKDARHRPTPAQLRERALGQARQKHVFLDMGKGIASLGWQKKERAFFELATLDLLTKRIGLFRDR